MALKDWKKESNLTWHDVGTWRKGDGNKKGSKRIRVSRETDGTHYVYLYTIGGSGRTLLKKSKTRQKAMAYTKKYMGEH